MGIVDKLKGFYYALEDKWYAFIDWLDAKGIPGYKFVDFFENRNIKSFPVALAIIVVIIAAIALLLIPLAQANVIVSVFDSPTAISSKSSESTFTLMTGAIWEPEVNEFACE